MTDLTETNPDQPMIAIDALSKEFGLLPILRQVSLRVAAGETVTIVGANGAGKSTLLKIVATLMRPTSGTVTIGGWPLATHADRVRAHIGLVSHQPLVYGDLSAEQNLAFTARLYGLDAPEQAAATALETVGLRARMRDPVRTFSRGMLQRLAIARATLHGPDVLLLDEPYTGLDQAAIALLDDLLRQQKALGRTILLITHDLAKGVALADQVAVLDHGRVIQTLPQADIDPARFADQYATILATQRKGAKRG